MPRIQVNGAPVEAAEGSTILEAARAAGLHVPSLCYLKERSAVASCRVCIVDVEGCEHPVPACATVVREGMRVETDSPRLASYRRIALELLLADHGIASLAECADCAADGACELQALCREYGVAPEPDPAPGADAPAPEPDPAPGADAAAPGPAVAAPAAATGSAGAPAPAAAPAPAREPVIDSNPFLSYDPNLCIACQRCVGACNNAARNHVLQTGRRGTRTTILAPFGSDWRATACESCGQCAQACPTGALIEKRRAGYRESDAHAVRTTCPHCGVGCQLDLVVADGRIVDARGADGPSNRGLLCVKGRSGSFDFLSAPDRLTTPLLRNAATGSLEPASWDEALDFAASRFSAIKRESGPDSLAAFACSRSTNEDVYLLQKLARTAFGTNNVDSCARV